MVGQAWKDQDSKRTHSWQGHGQTGQANTHVEYSRAQEVIATRLKRVSLVQDARGRMYVYTQLQSQPP